MDAISVYLGIWAVACLAVAGYAGYQRPKSGFWKWADPIYYPLAILGVALLFISSDNTRRLAELRGKMAAVDSDIVQLGPAPPNHINDTGADSISHSYRLLRARMDKSAACRDALYVDVKCIYEEQHAKLLNEVYKDFQEPTTPKPDVTTAKQVQDFCNRGNALIDRLI